MYQKLLKPIDNAPLIVFRIFFGFLLAAEAFGAIATGWVYKTLIEPEFTFSHIGMEWLQPLPGYGMYGYFALMGSMGLLVMLGYRYRLTLGIYTLMWAGVYFMQKSSYNNHYYLLLLVCLIMWLLPANRYASVDVKRAPENKKLVMPQWVSWVMIFQMAIVYFFATVAKFYPDWLDGTFTQNLFQNRTGIEFIDTFFSKKAFHLFIAYAGIAFDGLVIPMLLWKRTRTLALIASLVFHLFNSVTLQIGIFPFFALSFAVFFYDPETIRKRFLKKKPILTDDLLKTDFSHTKKIINYFFIPYFILQILLPIRHWFIKGDVLWTEEGHRLSWRMMLRHRNGFLQIKVTDKKTGESFMYPYQNRLTYKQQNLISSRPDAMWQFTQRLRKEYLEEGKDVSIYLLSQVSVNQKPYKTFIDPKIDFTEAKWNYFWHNDWILLYDKDGKLIEN